MERETNATVKWLFTPADERAPFAVQLLGAVCIVVGLGYFWGLVLEPRSLTMGWYLVVGGCALTIGWTVSSGRPIGLAGGLLFWSFHIASGFFEVLESGAVEDDVDLLLGIVAATALWAAGVWVLYGSRGFFLKPAVTDSGPTA